MTDARIEYWIEAVQCAFEEAGQWDAIKDIPPDKMAEIADALNTSQDCMSMAFYTPENPLIDQNDRLQKALKIERDKVGCLVCLGRGRIETQGPYHSSNSQCWKCHGEGKHAP